MKKMLEKISMSILCVLSYVVLYLRMCFGVCRHRPSHRAAGLGQGRL